MRSWPPQFRQQVSPVAGTQDEDSWALTGPALSALCLGIAFFCPRHLSSPLYQSEGRAESVWLVT